MLTGAVDNHTEFPYGHEVQSWSWMTMMAFKSFELATYTFGDPMRLERADAFAEGEYRSIIIGRVRDKLLSVVYTAPEDDLYRIISARFATSSERDDYEQNLFHS